ncbi:type II toxin-antitoxin system HicB family antitoxin [Castellaniella caeni]|uniref:type II toxin-antitoxin system HicB family antitoxin n=1 Tax=Castellaniella caeni TaxID=266123 RepID=UPI00082F3605|nr:type II toxin-antitoxin system HicB family antitoxin [Castellaniella caeni]
MKNIMIIAKHPAVISYDPDTEMFRGEFVGLNGGADFYATDIEGLHREGKISLDIFLEECARHGTEPHKHFSGKFILRIPPDTHEAATLAAAASGASLNQWISKVVQDALA